MSKKWVAKKKTLNFAEQELLDLEKYCQATGRTETEVVREALRKFLKQELSEMPELAG